MNGHMNLELKVRREIRIWGLGLGKCKECKFGDRYFKPRKEKKKIMETPMQELEHV